MTPRVPPSVAAPVIDVTALRMDPAGGAAAECVAAIDRACVETGFFVVTGHGLEGGVADVLAAAGRFFALAADDKQRVAMVGDDGYVPVGAARTGSKEMFDVTLGAARPWPSLPGFRRAVERYQHEALAVAADILRAMAIALDAGPDFFAERMCAPQCVLRLLHYPGDEPDVARGVGQAPADLLPTGAHTDYGALTLLATDGVPGLEIRPVGAGWTAVAVLASALVVNLGDMLARWTNGRYTSTPHRVVGGGERFSVPYFVNPDPGTRVTCLPSCVSASNPCRFAPITAAEFLRGRIDGTIPSGDGHEA